MKRFIASLACILGTSGAAQAVPVVPNFTSGTITANTESKTTIVETIRQQDYSNGYTYVVTGTNVVVNPTGTPIPRVPGNGTSAIATPTCPSGGTNLCYGSSYSILDRGQPFQLTETYMGPGIFRDTSIERTTTQEAVTTTTSVFTQ